ncbi:MAG: DUF1080 domain-containing protein [Phycisphaerae bacterium]|nr:DUF1080 domain-containing protein [Phycisphaerae bacterium]
MKRKKLLFFIGIMMLIGMAMPCIAAVLQKTNPNPDARFQFGIATYSFCQRSLDELLQTAQKLDLKVLSVKSCHLSFDCDDAKLNSIKQKINKAGIAIGSVGVVYMNTENEVNNAFEYARKVGTKMIIGVPKEEMIDLVEKKIKEYDIKVAIHNHGVWTMLYPSPESIYKLLEGRDKRLGLCIDVGHTVRLNHDPAEAIRKYADRVLDIHVWDSTSASADGKATLAGYGIIDFHEILQALIDIGYSGNVNTELWYDMKEPEISTAQTIGYLNGILNSLNYNKNDDVKMNTLSDKEIIEGWELLFDGKTTKGWRGINQNTFPKSGWKITNGQLAIDAVDGGESTNGGDIITVKKYSDFELKFEWKMLTRGGNSGVKYFVLEGLSDNNKHGIGPEFQILDDANHPWMVQGQMKPGDYYTVGSLYNLYKPVNKKLKPLGEYNHCKIISKGKHVEHWLNGVKVVEYERGSHDFKKRVSQCKLNIYEDFGLATEGHILLQDHGSKIHFRNIKIKEL